MKQVRGTGNEARTNISCQGKNLMASTSENRAEPENRTVEEERHLMAQAALNPAEFGPLYERYFERIFNYCYRRVGHPQEAEDLAARVFSNALRNLSGYRGGSVAAWLFQIAHNVVLNHLRARRPNVSLEQEKLAQDWPNETATTLDQLVHREKVQQVRGLIEELPDEHKDLLALSIIGEFNSKEIAQIIGKSDTAVRMQLHRIIKQLRQDYLRTEAAEEDF